MMSIHVAEQFVDFCVKQFNRVNKIVFLAGNLC